MKRSKKTFEVIKLYDETYAIADYGMGHGVVYCYLLIGRERALLIDSGYGGLYLHTIIGNITDKPVICACTHGHVDHALGAGQFQQAYLHSRDMDVYRLHGSEAEIRRQGREGIGRRPSRRMLNDPEYLATIEKIALASHPPLMPLEDVSCFDLGDRQVSWQLIPGHTQGSVAFWDEQHHAVFEGDGAPSGVWLFLPESSSLSQYATDMEKYLAMLKERCVSKRYTGHSYKPTDVQALESLIACVRLADRNPRKGVRLRLALGRVRLVRSKGAIVFCSTAN